MLLSGSFRWKRQRRGTSIPMPPRCAWVGCEGGGAPGRKDRGQVLNPRPRTPAPARAGQRHTEASLLPRPQLGHRLAWPGLAFCTDSTACAWGPRCQGALLHSTGVHFVAQVGHERRHPTASASGALALGSVAPGVLSEPSTCPRCSGASPRPRPPSVRPRGQRRPGCGHKVLCTVRGLIRKRPPSQDPARLN